MSQALARLGVLKTARAYHLYQLCYAITLPDFWDLKIELSQIREACADRCLRPLADTVSSLADPNASDLDTLRPMQETTCLIQEDPWLRLRPDLCTNQLN